MWAERLSQISVTGGVELGVQAAQHPGEQVAVVVAAVEVDQQPRRPGGGVVGQHPGHGDLGAVAADLRGPR
jgi:hypothetical protein